MADAQFDEILWQFTRRLPANVSEALEAETNDFDHFVDRFGGSVRDTTWPGWYYSSCEWLFAMLEVATCSGCIPRDPEPKVLAIAVKLIEEGVARGHFPREISWRMGLVKDYLGRLIDPEIESADYDDRLSHVMSEYMSLVDEFLVSRASRSFLDWARKAKGNGLALEAQQPSVQSDHTPALVLAGASNFVALLENCHARLHELDSNAALQSACWSFHATLFNEHHAFGQALEIQGYHLDLPGSANADGWDNLRAEGGYGELAEHWQEIQSRRARLPAIWIELSSPERWRANRTTSSWSEVASRLLVSLRDIRKLEG